MGGGAVLKTSILGLAALATGCAAMQAQYVAQTCNHDAAYAAGMNDGKNGNNMRGNYASGCPQDIAALNRAYSEGFKFGLKNTATTGNGRPQGYQCRTSFGNEVCGYHCVTSSGGNVRCAARPDQMCMTGGFGEIACGYNCAQSTNALACAQKRGNNCVGAYGEVRCGKNCRIEFGNIKCDKRER